MCCYLQTILSLWQGQREKERERPDFIEIQAFSSEIDAVGNCGCNFDFWFYYAFSNKITKKNRHSFTTDGWHQPPSKMKPRKKEKKIESNKIKMKYISVEFYMIEIQQNDIDYSK